MGHALSALVLMVMSGLLVLLLVVSSTVAHEGPDSDLSDLFGKAWSTMRDWHNAKQDKLIGLFTNEGVAGSRWPASVAVPG